MKTQCPNCKSKFNVNEANIGKQAKCPKCAKPFTIEPFTEIPAVHSDPVPVAPAAKSPAPVTSPAGIAEPAAVAALPIKSPVPVAPSVVNAEPPKQEQPKLQPASKPALSKQLFVYCWMVVRIIAGVLGALGLVLAIQKGARSTLLATFAAADVFIVCSVAIELVLFYKMWAAMKDSQPSVSPGRAVGFLFIPFFDIYWALLMLTGFTEDYNSFIIRRSIKAERLSMALFLVYAVLFVSVAIFVTIPMLCIFPFTGLISRAFAGYAPAAWVLVSIAAAAGLGHFITYILVVSKTCNAVNALSAKQGE